MKRFTRKHWLLITLILLIVIIASSVGIWYGTSIQINGRWHTSEYFRRSQTNSAKIEIYEYRLDDEKTLKAYNLTFIKLEYDGLYYSDYRGQIFYETHILQPKIVDAVNGYLEIVGEEVLLIDKYIHLKNSDTKLKVLKYSGGKNIGKFTIDTEDLGCEMVLKGSYHVSGPKPNPNNDMSLEIMIKDNIEINGVGYRYYLFINMHNYEVF